MVHDYQQKKSPKYTRSHLFVAVTAVKSSEMMVALASQKFNVPEQTIHDHVKGRVNRVRAGAPTVFTEKKGREIVVLVQEIGFGLTEELVGLVIRTILLTYQILFVNGIPELDWWRLFLKQWQ